MTRDARALTAGDDVEADLCIVGAGVAGQAIARAFAGSDVRVAVLESGGMEPSKAAQSLARGSSVGYAYSPLHTARARQVGGTSTRWSLTVGEEARGARFRPLDAVDFEVRPWLPYSGWPFGKEALQPYYERAQDLFGLGPLAYEGADWESEARPSLPLDAGRVRSAMFQFGERRLFSEVYPAELDNASNVCLLTHATVLEVEVDETVSRVTGLRVGTLAQQTFRVRARRYVLAGGGIEVPRLLLLSDTVARKGLGNEHDHVGRFFMEHPHFESGVMVPRSPEVIRRMGLYEQHETRGTVVRGTLAPSDALVREHRLLNFCVALWPSSSTRPTSLNNPFRHEWYHDLVALRRGLRRHEVPDDVGHRLGTMIRHLGGIGRLGYRQKIAPRLPWGNRTEGELRAYQLHYMTEQSPHPDSRVTLGDERDAFGQRRARLDWQLRPLDLERVLAGQRLLVETVAQAGLGRMRLEEYGLMPPPRFFRYGWHHMGTTRMHADPRRGVVDADARIHGVANLFVASSSVFPTSGYANPTLTIGALALRLADHLRKEFRKGASWDEASGSSASLSGS